MHEKKRKHKLHNYRRKSCINEFSQWLSILDVIVLNDIIEQASRRPSQRRSTIIDDDDGPR